MGRPVEGAAEDVLSNVCRCDGALVGEPTVRVRGHLVRFSEEQRQVHVLNEELRKNEARAILWTIDEDMPTEFWDEVRALRADEIDTIERNSTTVQLERLAADHSVDTLHRMPLDDPGRGIAALMVERNASDEDAWAEPAQTRTEQPDETADLAGGGAGKREVKSDNRDTSRGGRQWERATPG